jgi:hypothetical protein
MIFHCNRPPLPHASRIQRGWKILRRKEQRGMENNELRGKGALC